MDGIKYLMMEDLTITNNLKCSHGWLMMQGHCTVQQSEPASTNEAERL